MKLMDVPSLWYRLGVAALVVLTAGYMLVDGARALVVGDYFTIDGQLGPWAPIVATLGIEPRSLLMKLVFVIYGAAWLGALAMWLTRRASATIMLAFAVGALWYLVIGTVFALAQVPMLVIEARMSDRR